MVSFDREQKRFKVQQMSSFLELVKVKKLLLFQVLVYILKQWILNMLIGFGIAITKLENMLCLCPI